MSELLPWQYAAIALVFVWSGFVRSGLGFGGAVLSLPFLLLIVDDPLIFLPIIALHLLFFSSLIMWQSQRARRRDGGGASIDWGYLKYSLKIMMVPKLIGVLGLVTLPTQVMSTIVLTIVVVYSIGYILNKPFKSENPHVDAVFLALGGYVSGTSLIAAPLVMAVYSTHVPRHQLRDTLFVLWFVLVTIKMLSFVALDVDLQLIHHLWLLPAAFVGHLIGQRMHERLLTTDPVQFYRYLGSVLLGVSLLGMGRTLFS